MEHDTGAVPWRRTLYIVWAAEFTAVAGISLAIPFLPLYVQELGVKDPGQAQRWAGILVSANFVSASLMAPVWGVLGDRYGRKPMALRAIFGLSVALGLMALATRPEHLLVLRLVQGAVGGFVSASIALVASAVPRERLGHSLGVLQTSVTAGNFIGPLFGGVLADHLGYHRVFLITGAMCVAAGIIMAVFVHERFTPAAPEDRFGFRDNLYLLRTSPALRATFAAMAVTQLGLMTINPMLPQFVKQLEGGSGAWLRTKVGLIYSAPGLAAVIAAPLWGRKGDRVGHRRTFALALMGAGVLYFPLGLVRTAYELMAMRFCVGLCASGVSPSANAVVASSVDGRRTAGALSLLATAQWVGCIIGPLLGGFLSSALMGGNLGLRPMFPLTGIIVLGSGIGAWLAISRKTPAPLPDPEKVTAEQ